MHVARLEVEGGFLDSLDLKFEPGLNVLIGPRGVGKTSVIELIRYCLEVPGYTSESEREARKHALSVLRDGRVTVTIDVDGELVSATRSAEEDHARRSAPVVFEGPTILSQKEIELVGRDAGGRLRLIDEFRHGVELLDREEVAARATVASQTQEMQAISVEIEELQQQLDELKELPSLLEDATARQAEIAEAVGAAEPEQRRLDEIASAITSLGVELGVVERATENLTQWRLRLRSLASAQPTFEDWPNADEPTGYREVRLAIGGAAESLTQAEASVSKALDVLQELSEAATKRRLDAQDEARALRRALEQVQEGFGEASRRVADLREKSGQREALTRLLATKKKQLGLIQATRHTSLDTMDRLRTRRFDERFGIVNRLNGLLGPDLSIRLVRDGLHSEYAAAIAASLRGSGLQYNRLAPLLASRISPRELAEAIESGDASTIAQLGEIASDRAERAVAHIRQFGTSGLLTAPLDDEVVIMVVDGTKEKPTDEVSTGQRCTAILPILLSHEDRMLVVDQPEDHLDNAFIVSRVISALLLMGERTQLIFSTHNANIPVLGDAKNVILLGSDGVRGFRQVAGPLENNEVVDAITAVMEGGREAFEQRANFYKSAKGSPK
jgi:energy-coupling factor transporter ATP-binding protein EcfA2